MISPANSRNPEQFKIFLGFVPRTLSDGEILAYFSSFCSPLSSQTLHFDERGRPLFTNYKVMNVQLREDYERILGLEHTLCNQKLFTAPFTGNDTFESFIHMFSDKCVYLSGIPLTLNTDLIFDEINSRCKLKDLFILKNGLKVNKHYGFATFASQEAKDLALSVRKFKGEKFKITIKKFDMAQLKKMLPKEAKNEKKVKHHKVPLKKIALHLKNKSSSKVTEKSSEAMRHQNLGLLRAPMPDNHLLGGSNPGQIGNVSVVVNPSPVQKQHGGAKRRSKLRIICGLKRQIEKNHYWGNVRFNPIVRKRCECCYYY